MRWTVNRTQAARAPTCMPPVIRRRGARPRHDAHAREHSVCTKRGDLGVRRGWWSIDGFVRRDFRL